MTTTSKDSVHIIYKAEKTAAAMESEDSEREVRLRMIKSGVFTLARPGRRKAARREAMMCLCMCGRRGERGEMNDKKKKRKEEKVEIGPTLD